MAFGWLGTFRQGSWQAFRSFILEERRDVPARIQVIQAELVRIGSVTVIYGSTTDDDGNTVVTEERKGVSVSPGSTLSKLFQAYIALGGNPFDISLFLSPDQTVITDALDEGQPRLKTQPYGGVIAPESGVYASGDEYEGGYLQVAKYWPARMGGRKDISDGSAADVVMKTRKPSNQAIRYKRNDLEARIIKQMDLREQLQEELRDLSAWLGGVSAVDPQFDARNADPEHSLSSLVAKIDALFYIMDDDNVPDFTEINADALAESENLFPDISPDEDNTAL